jgi:hypothetical protein
MDWWLPKAGKRGKRELFVSGLFIVPQGWQFINNRSLFLTVLENSGDLGKSEMKSASRIGV